MTSHKGKNFKVKKYMCVCACVCTVYLGPSSKAPNLCSLLHICSLYKWVSGCRVRFRRKEGKFSLSEHGEKCHFLNIYIKCHFLNDQPRKCLIFSYQSCIDFFY